MKKGVLFTLGILMLVTIVFSLAILLFHNAQSTEQRFSELALLDRLSDFDGMIQNNIKDINTYEAGLFITVGNDSVSFTESFPRSSRFADVMTDYKSYIEENYDALPKITFDDAKISQIKNSQLMYITPYNIMYEHHNGFPGESYKLEPSSSNVLSYNVSLTVNAVSIQDPELADTGTFKVQLNIIPYEGGFPYIHEWKINPDIENTAEINLLGTGGLEIGDINLQVGSGEYYAYLDVESEKTRVSILEIELQEPANEPIEIKYSENLFTINFEESKLIKKGTVKLA